MDQPCSAQVEPVASPFSLLSEDFRQARRRAVRVRADTPVRVAFKNSDGCFTAPLCEFSPFGLSVGNSQPAVKNGSIFRLAMHIGADCFRAAAVVRVRLPGSFAVEFLSMTPWDRELMHRIYRRLLMAVCELPTAG